VSFLDLTIFFAVGFTASFLIRSYLLSVEAVAMKKKIVEHETSRQRKLDDLYGRKNNYDE
jgi:hypothetical protein